MTTTPQAALLSEADMLDCLREATHEIPTRIPPGWRKVMQAAEKRILAKLQDGRNTPFGREAEKLADNYLDLQAQYADAVAKLQATQEPVQSVPEAMKVVTEALRSDPDYAWSWHCNVAMASVDEGMGHYEANQAAARFMYSLAGVDTTKHQGFPEAPKKEPVQAGELPALPHDGWPARFRCDSCDGNGEIGELISMGHFQPPERQTCPDCGGRGWSDEGPAFNADHMRDYARAALSARKPLTDEQREVLNFLLGSSLLDGCAFGDRHPEVPGNFWWRKDLRDAFGIGLEVKP